MSEAANIGEYKIFFLGAFMISNEFICNLRWKCNAETTSIVGIRTTSSVVVFSQVFQSLVMNFIQISPQTIWMISICNIYL